MGVQASKTEPPHHGLKTRRQPAENSSPSNLFDDCISRSTADTEDSSVFGTDDRPSAISFSRVDETLSVIRNSTRSTATSPALLLIEEPTGDRSTMQSSDDDRLPPHSNQDRQYRQTREYEYRTTDSFASYETERPSTSAPMRQQRSRRVPIKKSDSTISEEMEESFANNDAQYLMRLYDARTWDMYARITESRKHQASAQEQDVAREESPTPTNHSEPDWEGMQKDDDADDDTIFLFDFEG